MLQEVYMDDALQGAPPHGGAQRTTEFPVEVFRQYMALNPSARPDTRLDPNAVYAKRGVISVSSRILRGADMRACVVAVERAFDPKHHLRGRSPLLVWLACAVGMWIQPHPVRGHHLVFVDAKKPRVATEAEAARHYGLSVNTARLYHDYAKEAVQGEWAELSAVIEFYGTVDEADVWRG